MEEVKLKNANEREEMKLQMAHLIDMTEHRERMLDKLMEIWNKESWAAESETIVHTTKPLDSGNYHFQSALDLPVDYEDAGSRKILHNVDVKSACTAPITSDTPGANLGFLQPRDKRIASIDVKSVLIFDSGGDERKNAVERSSFLERLKNKGYEVLYMVDAIDDYDARQLKKLEGKKSVSLTRELKDKFVGLCKVISGVLRKQAEQNFMQFQEQNLAGFLLSLAGKLPSDEKLVDSCKLACLILKNAWDAREQHRKFGLVQRWLSIDVDMKRKMKTCLLQTFSSPVPEVSQVIAKVASIEPPQKQWPDFLVSVLGNIHQVPVHVKQATLETLGYLCEEVSPDAVEQDQVNKILIAVVHGTNVSEGNNEIMQRSINSKILQHGEKKVIGVDDNSILVFDSGGKCNEKMQDLVSLLDFDSYVMLLHFYQETSKHLKLAIVNSNNLCAVMLFGTALALLELYEPALDLPGVNFAEVSVKNKVVWSAMIYWYTRNDKPDKPPYQDGISYIALINVSVKKDYFRQVLKWFRKMQSFGVEPEYVTINPLLSACVRWGALGLGRWNGFVSKQDVGFLDKNERIADTVFIASTDTLLVQVAISKRIVNFIHYLFTFLAGLVVSFMSSWELTLFIAAFISGIAIHGNCYAYTLSGLTSKNRDSYANVHSFIYLLANVYTRVGEKGVRLSCGQKQRIEIARDTLKNPKIFFIDETIIVLVASSGPSDCWKSNCSYSSSINQKRRRLDGSFTPNENG